MRDDALLAGLRLGLPLGAPAAVALLVLLLVVVVLSIREHRVLQARGRRYVLDALRIATALATLLLATQPQWVRDKVEQVQGRVALLVDVSRSMAVREAGQTRMAKALGAAARMFDDAKQKPLMYSFGDELTPITRSGLDEATTTLRDDTRLQHALHELAEQQGGDLGAVVLVSDGAASDTENLAPMLTRVGVKVHTVAVGGEGDLHDVSIEALRADSVAFLRQPMEVEVRVRAPREHDKSLAVTLRHGNEVVREQDVQLDAEGAGTVKFSFVPASMGRTAYSVSVPTPQDDGVPQNNERAFLVNVTRDKLRMLLVCGSPSWDARFLRALLKNDPAIDLISFFILRTQSDNSMASPDELSLIPFPTEELFEQHLRSFDLVIFQDFDFGPYQMARYLPLIRDYVMGGGSFAMLGGPRSFGPGGYLGTPIADVLPVTLVTGEQAIDDAELSPRLVPEATHHPLVELAPQLADNMAAWSALAPLIGVNRTAGLRSDAQALLVHPTLVTEQGQAMPVLAVGAPGQGRSMALMTDSSYRWGISTAGLTGDASGYERFWDRALRWLSRDPTLDPAQVTADKDHYGPGGRMQVQAWLRDARYQARSGGLFRVAIESERGDAAVKESPLEADAEGRGSVQMVAPTTPGAYIVAIRAEGEAEPIARDVFAVEAGGDELADPRARPDVLKAVAAASGGMAFDGDELPDLSRLSSTRSRVIGTEVLSPFASPWFYALFAALFSAEWWLRRRFGLR